MPREKLALGALALMLLLSGCADIAVEAEVQNATTIERYEVEAEMGEMTYGSLGESARSEGYSGIDEFFRETAANNSAIGSYSYEESREPGVVTVTLVYGDVNISGVTEDIYITQFENGNISYSDEVFNHERVSNYDYRINYTLTMPGEIAETNANRSDGNTAKWQYNSSNTSEGLHVEAESSVSSSPMDSSDPAEVVETPGFTGITAIAAALMSIGGALLSRYYSF